MKLEELENPNLWEREDPFRYAKNLTEPTLADKRWLTFLMEAKDEFCLRPGSVPLSAVSTIGGDFYMDQALISALSPSGIHEHLVMTHKELVHGAVFRSRKGVLYTEIHGERYGIDGRAPFRQVDAMIAEVGGRYDRDTLERTRRSTRTIASNMLAEPDYQYQVLGMNFVEGRFSHELPVVKKMITNSLRYLEVGGFFAYTFTLCPKVYVTSNGIFIPMPEELTYELLQELFAQLPVRFESYFTEEKIHPDNAGVALFAGRKTGEIPN